MIENHCSRKLSKFKVTIILLINNNNNKPKTDPYGTPDYAIK